MWKRLVFLVCFPLSLLRGSSLPDESLYFSIAPAPSWVKTCGFSSDSPIKPSQEHLQWLLVDTQQNWEEEIIYFHIAVKILDSTGIEAVSQQHIEFDPAYQKITVHALHIFRNGKQLDRLATSRHSLFQKEKALYNNIYEGNLTLAFFLDDIRVGDIIEYEYSIVGENPLFSSHFSGIVPLQYDDVIEKIHYRLLINPAQPLFKKGFNTDIEPQITDLSPTFREWSWEALETPPTPQDPHQPSWYEPRALVQLSQYETWQDFVMHKAPLFALPDDFLACPSPEIIALIEQWKESDQTPQERALLALRFVQDEIRYFGFDDQLKGWKPADPRLVFQRRFGVCRDKAVLCQALLKLMNINSTPILVNTREGKRLPEHLPLIRFDHAILQIEIDGTTYWVDPTASFQGGSLEDNSIPAYHWGLLLSSETTDLSKSPETVMKKPNEVDTSIIFTSPDFAEMKTVSTYYGSKADDIRHMIQVSGLKKISEWGLKDAQGVYKGATLLAPLVFKDDRERNILTLTESYRIPTTTRAGKKSLKICSIILEYYLDNHLDLERSTPYALNYPFWAKEHIHVENPFNNWAPDSEEIDLEHESMHYIYSLKKEGHTADFDFELKHLKDHVPVNSQQEYWNITSEIESNPSLKLVIAQPEKR